MRSAIPPAGQRPSLGRRLTLTFKMIAVTFLVGLSAWVVLDWVQTRNLDSLLRGRMEDRLHEQSLLDRLLFDEHIRSFAMAAKLFSSQMDMVSHINSQWLAGEGPPLVHESTPYWYPRPSIARAFGAPQHAILLDAEGHVREEYSAVRHSHQRLYEKLDELWPILSHNETLMTELDGDPHIIALQPVRNVSGDTVAYLLLSSQLDSAFLRGSQPQEMNTHIIALIRNDTHEILASSNPELIPEGTRLEDLEKIFLVTGRTFFDYGISDLLIQLATFISTREVDDLTTDILRADRIQNAFSAAALLSAFFLIIYLITRRVIRLSAKMTSFSRDNLGMAPAAPGSRDEIHVLEEQFSQMENGIIEARADLMMANLELRTKNLDLEAALRAAEEADRAKSHFLANMSHELRTPLNGIIGLTDITLQTELGKEQREFLKSVQSSALSLRLIINDILDFSKISHHGVEIASEPFSLREVFSDTMNPLALEAEGKGVSLIFDIKADVPDNLMGDQARLRQVMNNLLGNAVKFTEEGGVCASVSLEGPGGEGTVLLRFEVRDTGIGIPEGSREMIFKAFSQADSTISRKYGGTGLGLAITSKLVRLMGGELTLQGSADQGSTFSFALPFSLAHDGGEDIPTDPPGTEGLPDVKGVRVLLAEDNPVNQKLAMAVLGRQGFNITVASDGNQALELFSSGDYGLILMDVMMPEMDGLEATRRIRSMEKQLGSHVPIIAMTARVMPGDREKCIEAGMDDYIPKPIDIKQLIDIISRHLSDRPGST